MKHVNVGLLSLVSLPGALLAGKLIVRMEHGNAAAHVGGDTQLLFKQGQHFLFVIRIIAAVWGQSPGETVADMGLSQGQTGILNGPLLGFDRCGIARCHHFLVTVVTAEREIHAPVADALQVRIILGAAIFDSDMHTATSVFSDAPII